MDCGRPTSAEGHYPGESADVLLCNLSTVIINHPVQQGGLTDERGRVLSGGKSFQCYGKRIRFKDDGKAADMARHTVDS